MILGLTPEQGWWVLVVALMVAGVILVRTPRSQGPRRQWECAGCGRRHATLDELSAHMRGFHPLRGGDRG